MPRAIPLAAALAILAATPAHAATLPSRSVIDLVKVDQVDVGPAGDSVGDMTVFAFHVFDRTGGHRIGAGHGYCVRTEVGVASDCVANSSLPGGRIILQWEAHDGQNVSRAAVLGGTGRYRGTHTDMRLTATG